MAGDPNRRSVFAGTSVLAGNGYRAGGYEKHDVLMTNFGATRVGGAIEEREIRLGTMVQVEKEKMAVELKECTDRHDGLAQG